MLNLSSESQLSEEFQHHCNESYSDIGTIQLALEDIVEAIKGGRGGSLWLNKDKSGEISLCDRRPERILPIISMTPAFEPISGFGANEFHKQVALLNTLFDMRDRIKVPAIHDTIKWYMPSIKHA